MEKRKNIVSVGERGSITIFVLVAVIFFLAIAFTAYAGSISKTQTQEKEFEKIKMNYQNSYNDEQIRELYNDVVYGDKTVLEYAIGAKPTTTATIIEADETKGIVMVDDTGNEWVWVEVPKEVFATATSATDYDAIKADLIAYATDYRGGWSDTYYSGCGIASSDEYTAMYNKMLSSVYTNKGFYISRYEAGIEGSDTDISLARTERTEITSTSPKAVSKPDMIPYNYVYCSDAQTLASSMATGSKTSSLMFGIQWDLVCKYLEESGTAKANINSNSTSWGNYSDSTFTINSANAKKYSAWSSITGEKSGSVLLTTGASEYTNKMNIYDFAGNEWEWTLEKTTDTSIPCAFRGGAFSNAGSSYPASYRGSLSTTYSYYNVGFRPALY